VPAIDRLRRLPPLSWIFPAGRSIRREVTEDERKLTAGDLRNIRNLCPDLTIFRFRLLARLHRLLSLPRGAASPLEKMDAVLIRAVPRLSQLGGTAVLVLKRNAVG